MPKLGLAYGPSGCRLIRANPELIDYVEIPFELLDKNTGLISSLPLNTNCILHCASLSLGGSVKPSDAIMDRIFQLADEIRSPWLGEHIAFLYAQHPNDPNHIIHDLGFTLSPPMNEASAKYIASRVLELERKYALPIILENPPIYFSLPETNLSQDEFINLIFENCNAGFLLDLTHLYIVAKNFSLKFESILKKLPLEKVVEIHMSGVRYHNGVWWDNHSSAIPDEIMVCFADLVRSCNITAVTLEYNWISDYSDKNVLQQMESVKKIIL